MTAATAPSPSPAPSAQHALSPTRQSPISSDAPSSSRRHDGVSASASPAKATAAHAASTLGTSSTPIDLASPPASPTLAATTASASDHVVVSGSTRPSHRPSPSPSSSLQPANTTTLIADAGAASSPTLPPPPFGKAIAATNRILPPTPLGSATPTPSKSVHLPTPYKAPRAAQGGASESFATAYPTQETRQKYASPSKPLLSAASGATLSHKRSWQSFGSVDISNKKPRPAATAISSPAPSASSSSSSPLGNSGVAALPATPRADSAAAVTRSIASIPATSALTPARANHASSGVTVTNIPKPGSSISNQAGVGPLNLIPTVSGTELSATIKDEYLSLLQKSELIDLVKQLEKQLHDLIEPPTGASTLYRQARVYPNQIHVQIDRLKARQRIEASTTIPSSDLSLKDVYSLLNASGLASNGSAYARTPGNMPRGAAPTSLLTGRPAYTPPSVPRRPTATTSASSTTGRGVQSAQKQTGKDTVSNLINSINAMVRHQAQPARGPNGAPLPPAQMPFASSATSTAAGKARSTSGAAPQLSPAALRSIVGDGPMPSSAALAAAIAAHFGGSLPASTAASSRPVSATLASPSKPAISAASSSGLTATNAADAATSASIASKDISDKIAAILGSSSSVQTPMLGPQGLPLAPATSAPGATPIGNIAAMLSDLAGQSALPGAPAGSPSTGARTVTPAAQVQESALSSLLQQLEEAKKRMPAQATSTPAPFDASQSSANPFAINDPVAILTGASANPLFTPTYGASAASSPTIEGGRAASWSPEPEPVIVQGPLGTSTLPSYEDMIVEGLRVMGQAPPRTLFNWMQDTYPLMKKFRPSAHQALQKAFKRGRLLKTGSLYRTNPSWTDPGESRKPTRRPQVGRDHPMVTPGLNGEVLAVSPLKDSQAYRNVGDSGLRAMGKSVRQGPRPYGQPGAAPLANPASTIFPSGSATEILLEYQKRIGKKIEPDSVRYLYQLIRSGPSDGSMEEMLAHMLTQTGYHDAAAEATAAAAAQTAAAAAAAANMPSYPRSGATMPGMAANISSPSSMFARTGATPQRRTPATLTATGPTSLPLTTTSEPTMMQQLASMLNDLSSPINPVLANSLLGQLSSNAAAAAAARAASMPGMNAALPLPAVPSRTVPSASSAASSQLASALSSLTGQAPQQDLDSAVSETLAAALQQIGGPTAAPTASEEIANGALAKIQVSEAKSVDAVEGKPTDGEEGIDLAEYEDAIRALTSAFAEGDDDEAGSDESDNEADERAIAAAEAEPDSVEDAASGPVEAGQKESEAVGEAQAAEEEEDEEDEAEGGEQMDLTAVLRQLTASLQAHGEVAPAQGDEAKVATAAGQGQTQESSSDEAGKGTAESMDIDIDAPTVEPSDANATAEAEGGSDDPASLQAQLEALVASLAANAENADEEDEDEDGEEDDEEEEEGGGGERGEEERGAI